jgi:hypothetical protein
MVDFKHIADYFLTYQYIPTNTSQPSVKESLEQKPQPGTERVQGVRINCKGDIEMLKRPHYETVEVPITDPMFINHVIMSSLTSPRGSAFPS